ncbi:hypothetical protein EWM64_g10899 [Hericium alpestre]|uniref:Uncharacterized protein n=1 Tax=Hericium alpestre TaxID=135208 RepID=A0A4Y9ZH14_9AGAM|nr:hypothetical protein EWM64_g10899 [Hericium alpestre]
MFLGPGEWPELDDEEGEEEDGDVMAAFFDGDDEPWEEWPPQEAPEEVEIFHGHGLGEAAQIFASLGF